MPSLISLINEDMKSAMRAKDEKTLSALRMLTSAFRNKEISLRQGERMDLNDEQALEVLASEIKKRRDSEAAYEQGGRSDLADQEKSEIKILEKYMPAQLSDEDIEITVREIVAANPEANFGAVMGQAMGRLKGKADGNRVGAAVNKLLGN